MVSLDYLRTELNVVRVPRLFWLDTAYSAMANIIINKELLWRLHFMIK